MKCHSAETKWTKHSVFTVALSSLRCVLYADDNGDVFQGSIIAYGFLHGETTPNNLEIAPDPDAVVIPGLRETAS